MLLQSIFARLLPVGQHRGYVHWVRTRAAGPVVVILFMIVINDTDTIQGEGDDDASDQLNPP